MAEAAQHSRRSFPVQAAAFAAACAVPTYYALRGGSYDIVVRQEEALVVWLVVGLGYALGFLPRSGWPRGALVPLAGLAGLVVWTAIGLSWTGSDERTLAEAARALHFAGLLLLVWGLVGPTTWRPAAAGIATAAVFVCGMAVASRLAPGSFPDNTIRENLGTNRLSYPFGYWNAVGAWAVMSLAMALAWSAHARGVAARALALAVAPVCGLAIYMTYSRAAVIGTVWAIMLVIALSRNRFATAVHVLAAGGATAIAVLVVRDHRAIAEASGGEGAGAVIAALLIGAAICSAVAVGTWFARGDRWRVRPPLGRIAVAAATLTLLVLAVTAGRGTIETAWAQFRDPTSATVEGSTADPAARLTNFGGNRVLIWKSALRAFDDRPGRGIGAGTFEFWWNQESGGEFIRDAHSLYLEQLAELGLPGFVLLLAFLSGLGALVLLSRPRLQSTREYGAHAALGTAFFAFLLSAGVDWMWESTAVAVLAVVSAAVAAGARARPLRAPAIPLRAGVAAVALVAGLVQLPGLVSTSRVRDSQASQTAGHTEKALEQASDAVGAEPWAADPYVQRGLTQESAGDLTAAAVDLGRAVQREPGNWRHHLLLARVEAKRGRVRQALALYRQARLLRPESSFFR